MPTVALCIRGDVSAAEALPWIRHRAELLDLKGWATRRSPTEIEVVLTGPDPLIDAMEVACSLGPCSVLVDQITRKADIGQPPQTGFEIV